MVADQFFLLVAGADLGFFSTPSKYIFCVAKIAPAGAPPAVFFICTLRGVSRLAKTGMSTFFIVTLNQIYGVSTTSPPLSWQNRGRICGTRSHWSKTTGQKRICTELFADGNMDVFICYRTTTDEGFICFLFHKHSVNIKKVTIE